MRRRILLVGALLLAGCAAKLVPDDFAGPTATVRDSHANHVEGSLFKSDHAEFFVMTAADGKGIQNAFGETYVVRGKLGEAGSSVWIETAGGQRVTD